MTPSQDVWEQAAPPTPNAMVAAAVELLDDLLGAQSRAARRIGADVMDIDESKVAGAWTMSSLSPDGRTRLTRVCALHGSPSDTRGGIGAVWFEADSPLQNSQWCIPLCRPGALAMVAASVVAIHGRGKR